MYRRKNVIAVIALLVMVVTMPVKLQAEVGASFDALDRDKIERIAEMYALMYDVDPDLVRAVIRVESNFDRYAESPKGAQGVMQILPPTGESLGVDDLHSLNDNIDAGVRYLREMLLRFGGDVSLALAAYNAGPGAVEKYGGVPPFTETRNYVDRVIALLKSSKRAD